jgi:hypothetical protein
MLEACLVEKSVISIIKKSSLLTKTVSAILESKRFRKAFIESHVFNFRHKSFTMFDITELLSKRIAFYDLVANHEVIDRNLIT